MSELTFTRFGADLTMPRAVHIYIDDIIAALAAAPDEVRERVIDAVWAGNPEMRESLFDDLRAATARSEKAERERDELGAEVERLRKLLDRDQTGLARSLNAVRKILIGYAWIPDGEWGSYHEEERTFTTLRAEIGRAFAASHAVIDEGLRESGRRANEAFHPTAPTPPSAPRWGSR